MPNIKDQTRPIQGQGRVVTADTTIMLALNNIRMTFLLMRDTREPINVQQNVMRL